MSYVNDHALYGLGGDDVPQALMRRFNMSMPEIANSIRYLYINVGTTEFDAQWARSLVKAVQKGLSNAGTYRGPIDGFLGPQVEAALNKTFPPANQWRSMTWYTLLNNIAHTAQVKATRSALHGMEDLGALGEIPAASLKVGASGIVTGNTPDAVKALTDLQVAVGVVPDGQFGKDSAKAVYDAVLKTWMKGISHPGLKAVADKALSGWNDTKKPMAIASQADQLIYLVEKKPAAGGGGGGGSPPPPSGGGGGGGLDLAGVLSNPVVIAAGVFGALVLFVRRKK